MLSIILGILGSGGFGSLVGLIGGYFNRRLDIQARVLDIQDKAAERANDLLRMDKEREFMAAEYSMKLQVAEKEVVKAGIAATATVEAAGYSAMKDAFSFAATTPSDGWVDKFVKIMRPFLTVAFFIFTSIIFYELQQQINILEVKPTAEQVMRLYVVIVEWVIFQAAVCVGFWFAMRPYRSIK